MRGGDGGSLIDAVATPRQREIMDRLTAVMTLVEEATTSWTRSGRKWCPRSERSRERFNSRRGSSGRIEQTIRRILGIDLKMKQYAEGSRFVHGAVDEVGIATSTRSGRHRRPCRPRRNSRPRVGGAGGVRLLSMGPGVAVAEVRNAVRSCLSDLAAGDLVLVACSGGADSLALAAAAAFVAPRLDLPVGGVTVDHGLQPGSAERAAGVAALWATRPRPGPRRRGHGDVVRRPARRPRPGWPGTARSTRRPSPAVPPRSSGHTLDDQAETVLLGLARDWRQIAGRDGRPAPFSELLGVRRATTSAACAELGLEPWQDPHNRDFRFAPGPGSAPGAAVLDVIGPGVAEALARRPREPVAHRRRMPRRPRVRRKRKAPPLGSDPAGLDADWLRALPAAIGAGAARRGDHGRLPAAPLTAGHVNRVDALVTGWHGQRWVDLPGGVRARRQAGKVWFTSSAPGGRAPGGRPGGRAPSGRAPGGSAPGGRAPGD